MLALLELRNTLAPVLCAGVDAKQLPDSWTRAQAISLDVSQPTAALGAVLDDLYKRLRAVARLSTQTRLAVPYLVLAPTPREVAELASVESNGFAGFVDPSTQRERREQFSELRTAAAATYAGWPHGVYSDSRGDWRCCGPRSRRVREILATVVSAINMANPGCRELELLHDAKLQLRRYELDEYLDDRDGSRQTIELLCQRGCLIVVDEAALLHPALRAAAEVLLASSQSAIVSVSPCDPMHWPTPRMLGDRSFLRVGGLVERFRISKDLQCELALNSEERLEHLRRVPRDSRAGTAPACAA